MKICYCKNKEHFVQSWWLAEVSFSKTNLFMRYMWPRSLVPKWHSTRSPSISPLVGAKTSTEHTSRRSCASARSSLTRQCSSTSVRALLRSIFLFLSRLLPPASRFQSTLARCSRLRRARCLQCLDWTCSTCSRKRCRTRPLLIEQEATVTSAPLDLKRDR